MELLKNGTVITLKNGEKIRILDNDYDKTCMHIIDTYYYIEYLNSNKKNTYMESTLLL